MTTTLFHDLSHFVAIPRVTALRPAPDGSWLAVSVQTLDSDRKKYVTSIWRVDAQGGPPRRLTRSAEGEGSPRFLPDGSLLFTSKRPGVKEDSADGGDGAALWLLPASGGEARLVASRPGGITGVETADGAAAIAVLSPVLRDDERLRKERKEAGVTAILHESVPVRYRVGYQCADLQAGGVGGRTLACVRQVGFAVRGLGTGAGSRPRRRSTTRSRRPGAAGGQRVPVPGGKGQVCVRRENEAPAGARICAPRGLPSSRPLSQVGVVAPGRASR